ncbi:MAG: HAMP domain-containing protein [Deltaproteobacteria bacterium]|nr:HAMP domain-containing protein [Deltaproteobacteria bacterium]
MELIKNLPVATKFAFIAITIIVVATVVVVVTYKELTQLGESSDRGWQRLAATQQIMLASRLRDTLAEEMLQAANAPQVDTLAARKREEEIRTQELQLRAAVGEGKTLLRAGDRERYASALTPIASQIDEFIVTATEINSLLIANQQPKAQALLARLGETFNRLGVSIGKLAATVEEDTTILRETALRAVTSTQRLLIIAVVIAVSTVMVLMLLITRSLTVPMTKMTEAATRIAAGDINQQITYQSNDEVGALATAFRSLIQYLKSMADAADSISKGNLTVNVEPRSTQDLLAKSFVRMTENLRATSQQIQNSAQVVTTAISDILATTSQLTTSVHETATAVSQTASTVEEVKQVAHLSGQKAKQVSENAQETARISEGGKQALETALSGLHRGREQMQSIADSVIKLGEQSQTIGNIINSVAALAEQSNLLAVNAAIEAANAGEHGKGFAVVAREVKNLAEQSKRATTQVRAILGDIQKATNVVVLVTEQGTKAMEGSVAQAMEAGSSIRALTENFTGAAQAVTQIAASNQQQVIGMDQIATAITNVKIATAQNAVGMQQIQSATENLLTVGQTLKSLVEQYQLSRNGTHGPTVQR